MTQEVDNPSDFSLVGMHRFTFFEMYIPYRLFIWAYY